MKNVLVTGGSGLIGYNLASTLLQQGYNVYSTSGGAGNPAVGHVLYRGLFGIDVDLLPNKIDCLFHLSANNNTRYGNLEDMIRINVDDSMMMFDLCYRRNCRKFIYASSTAVYGNGPTPFLETNEPKPLTPYAKSKLQLEEEVECVYGDKATIIGLRYCNVYGEHELHKGSRASMIHQLLQRRANGFKPRLYKDGRQKRDWLHVSDVVQANILAMNAPSGIYNICSGRTVTFLDLVDIIWGETDVEWVDCPFPNEYQNNTTCNHDKASKVFGFSPLVTVNKFLSQSFLS